MLKMVRREHKLVVKALRELAKAYGDYGRVKMSKPVEMQYSKVKIFKPDLWAKTKRGEIDVYEVWYGESVDAAVADIFWSALVPNIRYLSIVCVNKFYSDPWTKEYARELFSTVSRHVYKDNKSAYNYMPTYIAEVTQEELKDYSRLKKHLEKELEFE